MGAVHWRGTRWRILGVVICAILVGPVAFSPAAAHGPVAEGAGPHRYPDVWCWDGRGDPDIGGVDQSTPIIAAVFSKFHKHRLDVGEYLTWRPFWRDRWTREFIWEDWQTPYFEPPYTQNLDNELTIDFPYTDNPRRSGHTQGYTFAFGHYYDVGAQYAWWDPTNRRWIVDTNWTPNVVFLAGGGYSRIGLSFLGLEQDDVCSLDPARYQSLIPLGASTASMPSNATPTSQLSQLRGVASSLQPTRSGSTTKPAGQPTPTCFGKRATIVGTEGPDTLVGTPGSDVIVGLGGDDVILGLAGGDLLCGGDGADGLVGGEGPDRISGENGNDAILGEGGPDFLIGGNGIDIIEGGAGPDRMQGGGQHLDVLAYLFAPTGITADFDRGMAIGEGVDHFSGFDAVVGSEGNDTLLGTSGEQWFVPLGGDDRVNGGPGSDVIDYLLPTQGVNVDLSEGVAVGQGNDALSNLEIVLGTPFDDHLVGDAAYNYLIGLEGDDVLDGVAGDDTLDAGTGVDSCLNGSYYAGCENQQDVFPTLPDSSVPPAPQ